MPSIIRQILSLPPGGLGRVVVGEKPINNNTGITVTAAIFFDGTATTATTRPSAAWPSTTRRIPTTC